MRASEPEDPERVNERLPDPSESFGGADSCNNSDPPYDHVRFSTGDEPDDPMAESLARVLHNAGIGDAWQGDDECPLHEDDEAFDGHNDPFYCEGNVTIWLITMFLLTKLF